MRKNPFKNGLYSDEKAVNRRGFFLIPPKLPLLLPAPLASPTPPRHDVSITISQQGMALFKRIDQAMETLLTVFSGLALPVIALLFLQWPLRDLVQAGSREANDLGQWLFALYVASSLTMASRKNTHLKSDFVSRHFTLKTQHRIKQMGLICALIPWACFILWAAWPIVRQSVGQWERFAETGNPGYFLIKLALIVMAMLIVVQALLELLYSDRTHKGPQ